MPRRLRGLGQVANISVDGREWPWFWTVLLPAKYFLSKMEKAPQWKQTEIQGGWEFPVQGQGITNACVSSTIEALVPILRAACKCEELMHLYMIDNYTQVNYKGNFKFKFFNSNNQPLKPSSCAVLGFVGTAYAMAIKMELRRRNIDWIIAIKGKLSMSFSKLLQSASTNQFIRPTCRLLKPSQRRAMVSASLPESPILFYDLQPSPGG